MPRIRIEKGDVSPVAHPLSLLRAKTWIENQRQSEPGRAKKRKKKKTARPKSSQGFATNRDKIVSDRKPPKVVIRKIPQVHRGINPTALHKCRKAFVKCDLDSIFDQTIHLISTMDCIDKEPFQTTQETRRKRYNGRPPWRENRLECWGRGATVIGAAKNLSSNRKIRKCPTSLKDVYILEANNEKVRPQSAKFLKQSTRAQLSIVKKGKFNFKHRAAVKIQKVARGRMTRRKYLEKKRVEFLTRADMEFQINNAQLEKALWKERNIENARVVNAEMNMHSERKRAATKIQSIARRGNAKLKVDELKATNSVKATVNQNSSKSTTSTKSNGVENHGTIKSVISAQSDVASDEKDPWAPDDRHPKSAPSVSSFTVSNVSSQCESLFKTDLDTSTSTMMNGMLSSTSQLLSASQSSATNDSTILSNDLSSCGESVSQGSFAKANHLLLAAKSTGQASGSQDSLSLSVSIPKEQLFKLDTPTSAKFRLDTPVDGAFEFDFEDVREIGSTPVSGFKGFSFGSSESENEATDSQQGPGSKQNSHSKDGLGHSKNSDVEEQKISVTSGAVEINDSQSASKSSMHTPSLNLSATEMSSTNQALHIDDASVAVVDSSPDNGFPKREQADFLGLDSPMGEDNPSLEFSNAVSPTTKEEYTFNLETPMGRGDPGFEFPNTVSPRTKQESTFILESPTGKDDMILEFPNTASPTTNQEFTFNLETPMGRDNVDLEFSNVGSPTTNQEFTFNLETPMGKGNVDLEFSNVGSPTTNQEFTFNLDTPMGKGNIDLEFSNVGSPTTNQEFTFNVETPTGRDNIDLEFSNVGSPTTIQEFTFNLETPMGRDNPSLEFPNTVSPTSKHEFTFNLESPTGKEDINLEFHPTFSPTTEQVFAFNLGTPKREENVKREFTGEPEQEPKHSVLGLESPTSNTQARVSDDESTFQMSEDSSIHLNSGASSASFEFSSVELGSKTTRSRDSKYTSRASSNTKDSGFDFGL